MTTTFKATGNWGALVCDAKTGNVIEYMRGGDWEKDGDGYDTITRLDVDEWCRHYPNEPLECAEHDILDFGSWDKNNNYEEPAHDWRKRRRDGGAES